METPRFQFGLKAVLAATTGATLLLATFAAMTGTATAFGMFSAMVVFSALGTLGLGIGIMTCLFLMSSIATVIIKPLERQPSLFQFRIAALLLSIAAAIISGVCVLVITTVD